MPRLVLPVLLALLPLAVSGVTSAHADFTIEGNLETMTVDATDADRDDIVASISKRFGVDIVNGAYDGSAVTGRFHGTLSEVLRAVVGGNGFAIAYEGGRPSRVTFASGRAASTYVAHDKKPVVAKGDGKARPANTKPVEKPARPATAAEQPDGALSRAQATQQAVRELEALLKAARSDMGK